MKKSSAYASKWSAQMARLQKQDRIGNEPTRATT